jgi:hypothetical protein
MYTRIILIGITPVPSAHTLAIGSALMFKPVAEMENLWLDEQMEATFSVKSKAVLWFMR